MMRFTSTMLTRWIGAAVLCTSLSACAAKEIPADWKSECVGRMALSLPGEAEVAANTPEMLVSEYKVGSIQPRFNFIDGQNAGWSAIRFLGRIYVSHALTVAKREQLMKAVESYEERAKNWAMENKNNGDGEAFLFEKLNVKPHIGSARRVDSAYSASLFIEDHLIWLSSSGKNTNWTEQRKDFDLFMTGVATRPIGHVPNKTGICLPYFFIKDEGGNGRQIAMTYRLKGTQMSRSG